MRSAADLLTFSPFAVGVRDRAVAELDAQLRGSAQHRALLALITAANGLTGSELTDMAPFEIDALLRGAAAHRRTTPRRPTRCRRAWNGCTTGPTATTSGAGPSSPRTFCCDATSLSWTDITTCRGWLHWRSTLPAMT